MKCKPSGFETESLFISYDDNHYSTMLSIKEKFFLAYIFENIY